MKYIVSSANRQCLHKIAEEELRKLGISVNLQESISSVQNDSSKNKEVQTSFGHRLDCQSKVPYLRKQERICGEDSETESVEVPAILFKLCEFLKKDRLITVGLFRVPGGKSRIKVLKSQLEHGEDIEEDYAYTHDIASLLKTFLRQLPEPVLPIWSHDVLVDCTKLASACDKTKALLLVCSVLPCANIHLLIYLFDFLSEVVSYSDQNKMNLENVCSMMTPNLIKPNQSSVRSVENISEAEKQMGLHNEVVEQLCLLHKYIGCLPEDIYNRVCKGKTCLHLSEDSSLCSENATLLSLSDTEAGRQKRKSLTERVGTTLSKLMKNNTKTPLKQEHEQSLKMTVHTPKIRPKRLSDVHDANTQTSKRRSLQGFVLPSKELPPGARVTPMIVVTPPEQEVISRFETKPNCNFTNHDTATFTPSGLASGTTADNSVPKSAKRLFRKFIRVKSFTRDSMLTVYSCSLTFSDQGQAIGNDSGDTSCFCKRQQETTVPPSQKKHSGRIRRSLRRNLKRKSMNRDNPDNDVIISLPVGDPDHSQMASAELLALASSSPDFYTDKNDKPSFFKRLSSPRPSPKLPRRRSAGVVSRLTSPFSHNKRSSRKSQRHERSVSNFTEPDKRPLNDEGSRCDSSLSRSTDTLDSLASNQTAETLDVLEDPDKSPPLANPNENPSNFCTTELKPRANGFDNTAFDGDRKFECSKCPTESPTPSTSGDSEPCSVNLNDSIFDLSFGTLIRMNDPNYRKNERAKADESLVNLFQDHWDSLASVDAEAGSSPRPDTLVTSQKNAGNLKLLDAVGTAARSPLKRPRNSSTDEQLSPEDCSEKYRDAQRSLGSETTDSSESAEETYKKFDEVDAVSLCEAAAEPKKHDVASDDPMSDASGNFDRGECMNSVHDDAKHLPVHKSDGCPKLSTFKRPTRAERPIRVNFRTSVLHPSPAKAPRISRSIQKSYSCKGRQLSEKPTYRSARSKVKTETPALVRSKSVQVTSSSPGIQNDPEARIPKSLMQTREMQDAHGALRHSVPVSNDQNQNKNEVARSDINAEETRRKKPVCHKNPSVARVRVVSTPSPSITRSRVISRRSGGQLPRVRNLSRAARSPSKPRARKHSNTPTKRYSSSRKSKYTPTKCLRKKPDSGFTPGRCVDAALDLATESASSTYQTLANKDTGLPGSPQDPAVISHMKSNQDVILGPDGGKSSEPALVYVTEDSKSEEKEFAPSHDDKWSVDISTCKKIDFSLSPAKSREHPAPESNEAERSDRDPERNDSDDLIAQEAEAEDVSRQKSLTSSGGKWSSDSSLYNLVKSLNLDVKESGSVCGGEQRKREKRRRLPWGYQAGHVSECISRFNALANSQSRLKSQLAVADSLKPPKIEDGAEHSALSQNTEQPKNPPESGNSQTDDAKERALLRTPKIKQPLLAVGKGKTVELRRKKETNSTKNDIIEAEDSGDSGDAKSKQNKNRLLTPNSVSRPPKASVVHSSPRPRRSPLVIRNLNTCQDILNYSPVKRATPQAPRSRKPILPSSVDKNLPIWSRHNRTLSESDVDFIADEHDTENKYRAPSTSKHGIASPELRRRNPNPCGSMELLEAESSFSAKPYQSFTTKDLGRTISNPITVIDSKSVKHTLV